jgi:hypothetical protein
MSPLPAYWSLQHLSFLKWPQAKVMRSFQKAKMLQPLEFDNFVKSRQSGRHRKKLQMQGARILRNEAYIEVRRNDER